jgi:hypothetical protein
VDRGANETETTSMWAERFQLTQRPKEKAENLVRAVDRWPRSDVLEGNEPSVWYNFDFPEYTIEIRYRPFDDFYEPWMERKNLKSRPRNFGGFSFRIKYLSTTLTTGVLFMPRHTMMPFPSPVSEKEYSKENVDMEYVLRSDSSAFMVGAICSSDRTTIEDGKGREDYLLKYYRNLLADIQVMFGGGVFELELPN